MHLTLFWDKYLNLRYKETIFIQNNLELCYDSMSFFQRDPLKSDQLDISLVHSSDVIFYSIFVHVMNCKIAQRKSFIQWYCHLVVHIALDSKGAIDTEDKEEELDHFLLAKIFLGKIGFFLNSIWSLMNPRVNLFARMDEVWFYWIGQLKDAILQPLNHLLEAASFTVVTDS